MTPGKYTNTNSPEWKLAEQKWLDSQNKMMNSSYAPPDPSMMAQNQYHNLGSPPQKAPDFMQPPQPFNPNPYQSYNRSTGVSNFQRSPVNPNRTQSAFQGGPVQQSQMTPAQSYFQQWKANKQAGQPTGLLGSPPQVSPTAPVQPAPMQNLYQNLNANSGAGDIAAAYNQWAGANGGNTQANQSTAMNYLQNLGIGMPTINQAYNQYQQQYTPFGLFGNQMSNWANSYKKPTTEYGGYGPVGGNY